MPLGTSVGRSTTLTRAIKRTVDIALGTVLSLIAFPIVLVLAVALAVTLRAFPVFIQERPGRNGQNFRIVKLRTLPPATPHYASKLDLDFASIPRLCSFVRRTHLDELPQLFLVPLGAMSLVGPRPRQADGVEGMDANFDGVRRQVRPGCTGLWQVGESAHQLLNDAPQFDLFYLRFASLRLDIWIMLRTVAVVLGFAEPVSLDDVPAWIRGRGLLAATELILRYGEASAFEDESEAVAESAARIGYILEPSYPVGVGFRNMAREAANSVDGALAEPVA